MELAMDKGFDATVVQDMQRWLERAVIGLNLCPFAKAVHVKQQVRYVVCTSDDPEVLLQDLRRELLHLAAADPEQLDTTLLIAPRCLPDFLDFNDFLNQADAVLLDLGLEGDYQIADFHPRYQFADTEVDDMGNFSNRAPYPTLHLLREDSIDRAVEAFPEADAIFEQNIARLEQLGPAGWRALDVGPHLGQQKDAP
jgi:hypothetical protein